MVLEQIAKKAESAKKRLRKRRAKGNVKRKSKQLKKERKRRDRQEKLRKVKDAAGELKKQPEVQRAKSAGSKALSASDRVAELSVRAGRKADRALEKVSKEDTEFDFTDLGEGFGLDQEGPNSLDSVAGESGLAGADFDDLDRGFGRNR